MKVALVMPFKNDLEALRYILPKIPKDLFELYLFLDTGSTDGSRRLIADWLPKASFIEDNIDHLDFGRWRTMLMDEARRQGMDWVFMLDTDEAVLPEHYQTMFQYINSGVDTLYRMARLNFTRDENWFDHEHFPDFQARIIKLDTGYYYEEKLHAQPKLNKQIARGTVLPQCWIYHYSFTKNGEKHWVKQQNYKLTAQGKPIISEVPKGAVINQMNWDGLDTPFYGKKP